MDGYVELVLENRDQVISQGWSIEPHVEPLRVSKMCDHTELYIMVLGHIRICKHICSIHACIYTM